MKDLFNFNYEKKEETLFQKADRKTKDKMTQADMETKKHNVKAENQTKEKRKSWYVR